MPQKNTVAVIGCGEYGVLLSKLLSVNHNKVLLWVNDLHLRETLIKTRVHPLFNSKIPDDIEISSNLEQVVKEAKTIFIAVPPQFFRKIVCDISPFVEGDHILISASKGLEGEDGTCLSDIFLQETCVRFTGSLAGPINSYSFDSKNPLFMVIGSRFDSVISTIQRYLSSESVYIYGNHDIIGVELGSSFATIPSFLSGVIDEIGLGRAITSVIITRSLPEIERFSSFLQTNSKTFYGLSCLSDMIFMSISESNRNFILGKKISQAISNENNTDSIIDLDVDSDFSDNDMPECYSSIKRFYRLSKEHNINAPLVSSAYNILLKKEKPADVLQKLMNYLVISDG